LISLEDIKLHLYPVGQSIVSNTAIVRSHEVLVT